LVNKNAAKTHTVLESFNDILECETAQIDGRLYKKVAEPQKGRFKKFN
jgi:hypothetical protein